MTEETKEEKTPESFNAEWYKLTLGIIQQNRGNFPDDAELQLAEASGGMKFRRALDNKANAPCEEGTNCSTCWVDSYCQHKGKTEVIRLQEVATEKSQKEKKEEETEKNKKPTKTLDINDLGDIL